MARWSIQKHDGSDTEFEIIDATDSIRLTVYYDDCDHERVDKESRLIVAALNSGMGAG